MRSYFTTTRSVITNGQQYQVLATMYKMELSYYPSRTVELLKNTQEGKVWLFTNKLNINFHDETPKYPPVKMKTCPHKDFYLKVHRNITHNNQ